MTAGVAEATARRFASQISLEQRTARIPSMAAGVVRNDELVWSGTRGSHTGSVPPTTDLQYRIGSITKPLTAVLVMQLRDEGALDLNDRLEEHLPGVGYGDRTLRSLLSHSSGMQSEPHGSWWERSPGGSFDDLVAAIDDSRSPHPPGSTYHYTNVAYGLLGELVARKRGVSWFEALRDRILVPLGMTRTCYLPAAPAASGFSVHHFANTLTPEPAQDTGAMAPAGQLWSTVEDLARFAAFLVHAHPDVLAAETLSEMTIPQTGALAAGLSGGYGLGLRLLPGGSGTLVGHTGSMPGFQAGCFVDRVRRTGALVLTNGTAGLRSEGLPVDLLGSLEELEPTVVDAWVPADSVPGPVAAILGVWHWGNTAYGFAWTGSEVTVTPLRGGPAAHRFRPRPDGTFLGTAGYHLGETLEVVRNDDGSVNHLVCATFVYTRVPYDPAAPIPGGGPVN